MLACFLGHSLHVVQHALFATPAEIMPLGTAILLIGGSVEAYGRWRERRR